jgi:serine/threonine protein kinase
MTTHSTTPAKIGRYPVLRVLGKGAMGCVYLARDSELERDVAIKTVRLPQGVAEQESFLVRFRNEARAVGRLRHRSIVSVYDVGNDPESGPFLVFEYIEGANLKDILRSRGPLTPPHVVALAEQVGGALDAAHAAGIIHRDIKPENLLVGNDQVVHLADFGVARVPDAALTGEGQFLGTPCYGAPETLLGGEASPLSDQFSFAAVLYEAASGERAFPGSEALAVAHAVIHDQPKPPSKVAESHAKLPRAVDDVIMRALAKQPEQRFSSISELVRELRSAYVRASLLPAAGLSDTVPALLDRPRSTRDKPAGEPRRFPLWPIGLFLVAGVIAAFQLAPSVPAADDTTGDITTVQATPTTGSVLPPLVLVDAAGLAAQQDAGLGDAAANDDAALDADAPQLSSFEREERAKDALERAEKALSAGDHTAAKAALDEAESFDPEHPDIAALRRKL